MVRYLVRNQQCDPEYPDFEEQTPLHHVCGWLSECTEEQAVDIAKFLIKSAKCDPRRKDLNGKDALLHACEKGLLGVARYLIEECQCDVTVTDYCGNTLTHLAVSFANSLELVQYLFPKVPKDTKNKDGNTLLHSACAANSDLKIVKYLLTNAVIDPHTENSNGKTPIDLTSDLRIARLLISHGTNPSNAYVRYGRTLSLEGPLSPLMNVITVGDLSSGKTMLLRSLQKEVSLSLSFSQHKMLQRVEEKTKGIELQDHFVSNVFGRVNFYEFGGSVEYRSSHAAVLRHIAQCHFPVFLVVVDLSQSEKEVKERIVYWLSFLGNHCTPLDGTPRDVLLIGTHSDVVKSIGEDPKKKLKNLSLDEVFTTYSDFKLVGQFGVDCQRPESSNIVEVRQALKASQEKLQTLGDIRFNSHCLYEYVTSEFGESVAVSLSQIRKRVREISPEDSSVDIRHCIPDDMTLLVNCCDNLHSRGHIFFLKHTTRMEKSLVVVDKVTLLSEIFSTVFSRKESNPSGVISHSAITKLFPSLDPDVLSLILTHLELSMELPSKDVLKHEMYNNSKNTPEDNRYLYIPSLVTRTSPKSGEAWDPQPYFKFNSGWMLQCTDKDTNFDLYFLDALLCRYASLVLNVPQASISNGDGHSILPICEVQCSFWKGGMYSSNCCGIESILEFIDGGRTVFLLVRFKKVTPECLRLRSQLISLVLETHTEISCNVHVAESFIDPYEVTDHPLKPTSLITVFDIRQVSSAILKSKRLSVSGTDNELSLENLLTFDPYHLFNTDVLECFFDESQPVYKTKISDTFLSELASQISPNRELFVELLSHDNTAIRNQFQKTDLSTADSDAVGDPGIVECLKVWRESGEGTYKCLRELLDQFSVLAGRNLLVRSNGLCGGA